MCVRDRLKAYLKHKKISQSSFAESIDVSAGYVNAISKGIGTDKMSIIRAVYQDLNIDWLLTGKGSMLKTTDQLVNQESDDNTLPEVDPNNLGAMKRFFDALERKDRALERRDREIEAQGRRMDRLITIIERMSGAEGAGIDALKKEG